MNEITRPIYTEENESSDSQYQIEDSDISKKSGNYVLTFGRTNSGKSTIQQHIISWLYEKSEHGLNLNPVDGHFEPVVFLQEWIEKLRNGELPDRTPRSKQTEFNITITPKNNRLPILNFGFFEISGEQMKAVVPKEGKGYKPSLPKPIHKFLSNKRIMFSFLFVSDARLYKEQGSSYSKSLPREDILFCDFLNYIENNFGKKFSKTPILFVISKWDEVEHIYNDSETYMEKNLNQTFNRLREIKSKRVMVNDIKHSIGKIEELDGKAIIKGNNNFDSTKLITEWIYESFTNKSLDRRERKRRSITRFLELF